MNRLAVLAIMSGMLVWCGAVYATTIVHGPRIGLVTGTAATIYWDTDTAGVGTVSWGTTNSYGSSLAETSSVTAHRLTITGLAGGTTYHYKVATGGVSSADYTFSTAVPAGTDFTFITMADSRGNSASADEQGLPQSFINIITRATAAHASFALFGGDMFYGSSTQATQQILYDEFKIATDPLAHTTPFLVAVGNHEMDFTSYSTIDMFNQEFAQPQTGPSGYPGTVFSFDWGNTHIAIVDTCHVNTSANCGGGTNNCMYYMFDDMLTWLDQDLASAQSRGVRHIFVMGHSHAYADPSWTLNYMGNYPTQRDKFWTILANHKVDAYICGHIHEFHDNLGQQGVVQWLNGNSGAGTGPYNWTLWQIHGDTATATLYDDSGAQITQLAIQSSQGGGCTSPTVSVSSPAGGATVTGVVTLAASVSASPAPTQVSFAVDGTTVATVTSSPWSASWNSASVANGSHTVVATAVNSCASTTSSAVSVTVSNTSATYSISGTVSGAATSGVTMTLSGAASKTTTTASDGTYTFSGLANGSYTVTPSKS
ncbi:MAG: metallophosphoesterase, partial [Acidobacteria bacterium]|nr:metallophosphoesterase [Acidobacteriota bacterium]